MEDRDIANEELQTATEEIRAGMRTQSINEELETSKKELQAINEMTTANQSHTRNEQIKAAQLCGCHRGDGARAAARARRTCSSNNTAFISSSRWPQDEGRRLAELGSGQWNIARHRTFLEQVPDPPCLARFCRTPSRIGKKTMLLNARRIVVKLNRRATIPSCVHRGYYPTQGSGTAERDTAGHGEP